MLTAIRLAVVLLAVGGNGSDRAETRRITKADIPANISSDLRGLLEELVASDNREDSIDREFAARKKLRAMGEHAVPAIPFLIKYAVREEEYRTEARFEAETFEMMGDRAAQPCLHAIKQLPSTKRETAAQIFAGESVPWMLGIASDLLLNDPDPKVRYWVAWELHGNCPDPRTALPALIRAIKDKDPEVR